MTITFESVRLLLAAVEPDYAAATSIGPEALPHLETLARGSDQWLAAKAVYFASLIDDPRAVDLIVNATTSPSTTIRVQAAAGARNLPRHAVERVVSALIHDSDIGVRTVAVKSAKAAFPKDHMPSALQGHLSQLMERDPEQFLRELARSALP